MRPRGLLVLAMAVLGLTAQASNRLPGDLQPVLSQTLGQQVAEPYRFRGESPCATNPRHGFTTCWSQGTLAIHATNGTFRLELVGVGRAGQISQPAPAATPKVEAGRLTIGRGSLLEWYVNLPQGLEQGFTLHRRPPGEGDMILAVDVSVPPRADDTTMRLGSLDYSGLYAVDADGREVPAHMEARGTQLRLVVDDRGARYPVIVDPWISENKLSARYETEGSRFGWAVALSGKTAIVGAPKSQGVRGASTGVAYAFRRSRGNWVYDGLLRDPRGAADGLFGYAVALSGNVALVGAPGKQANQGAAYVFERVEQPSGEVYWIHVRELTASDAASGAWFGTSVALAPDARLALVGAPAKNGDRGAAYAFEREGPTWTQAAKLVVGERSFDDYRFGQSVALGAMAAFVGAPGTDVEGNADHGAVHVFDTQSWERATTLSPTGEPNMEAFGHSVALGSAPVWTSTRFPRTLLAVGIPGMDVEGNTDQGAVRVYTYAFPRIQTVGEDQPPAELSVSGLAIETMPLIDLIAEDGGAHDALGQSVGISGHTVVAGAWRAEVGDNTLQGAAYVFSLDLARTDGLAPYEHTQKLTLASGAAHDWYGWSVAVSGDLLLAGAPFETGTVPNAGAVHSYRIRLPLPSAQQDFGTAMAPFDPIVSGKPFSNRPFGAGQVLFGTFTPHIGLPLFDDEVDVYLGISLPDDPEIYLIRPDLSLQALSDGLVAWKRNTRGDIDVEPYGDVPLNDLPEGVYTLYVMVKPAGTTENYYLWRAVFPHGQFTR